MKQPITALPDAQDRAVTILHRHWLLFARTTWIVLVVFAAVVVIAAGYAQIQESSPECTEVTCDRLEFTSEDLRIMEDLGLPRGLSDVFDDVGGNLPPLLSLVIVAVILWRRSNDWMAMLISFTLVVLLGIYLTSNDDVLLRTQPGWETPLTLVSALGYSFFLVLMVFPDGRFVPRWTRPLIILAIPFFLVTELFWTPVSDALGFPLSVVVLGIGVYGQVYRYLRVSNPVQRQQTKWVMVGLMGVVIVFIIRSIAYSDFPSEEPSPARVYFLLTVFPILMLAKFILLLSIIISVLRYRLWDIDILINRTLVYGILTATLAGTYFGGVVLLQMAFRAVTEQGNAVAIVISTLAIAALFMPLRGRVQNIIDRLFYRRKYDASRTLAAFSIRMRDEVDLERLTGELVSVVRETMQPAHVSLWMRKSGNEPSRSA